MSSDGLWASPHASEASVNTVTPMMKMRLRPKRSARDPWVRITRREAQGVGRDDPLQVAEAGVQRPLHGGQGHLDDGDVHQEHERRPAHGDEGPPVALVAAAPTRARSWGAIPSRPPTLLPPAGPPTRGAGKRLEERVSFGGAPGVQDQGADRDGVGSLCAVRSAVRSVWTSRRAVSLHVALVVFVPGCVALTWWQVSRALGGNTLSWVYTFEWPIFAAYATYMWWKLVHDDPAARPDQAGAASKAGLLERNPDPGSWRHRTRQWSRGPWTRGHRRRERRRVGGLQPVPGRPQRQRAPEAVVTGAR